MKALIATLLLSQSMVFAGDFSVKLASCEYEKGDNKSTIAYFGDFQEVMSSESEKMNLKNGTVFMQNIEDDEDMSFSFNKIAAEVSSTKIIFKVVNPMYNEFTTKYEMTIKDEVAVKIKMSLEGEIEEFDCK